MQELDFFLSELSEHRARDSTSNLQDHPSKSVHKWSMYERPTQKQKGSCHPAA